MRRNERERDTECIKGERAGKRGWCTVWRKRRCRGFFARGELHGCGGRGSTGGGPSEEEGDEDETSDGGGAG